MIATRIEAADPALVDRVARQCGDLAISCTDVAGGVGTVASDIARQIDVLGELQAVMAALETDQRQIADATDEARLLSETARVRLSEGALIIADSITEFSRLTALVRQLGAQLGSFAAAMQQVRRTSETIDGIARTTNMLALNATIEAERAGPAGRTFAVVAAEVKKLASDTRAATDEIGATMDSLRREGDAFVEELTAGMARSREAEQSFARVTDTVADVTRLVEQVEGQADDIARSTSVIHSNVCRVGDELEGFSAAAVANNALLGDVHRSVDGLELKANEMLDTIVHSGFAHDDRTFVDMAIAGASHVQTAIEAALRGNKIDAAAVFDTAYRPIEHSDPAQYASRFNALADAVVQPILDRASASDGRIIGAAITDMNGYLPTHLSERSLPQRRGDPKWNAIHSRNRRILMDDATARAIGSEADFLLTTYRQDLGENGYRAVKNVFVPLHFQGRRWGNFEIAYVD